MSTDERSRRTQSRDEEGRTNEEEQALLRDQSPDINLEGTDVIPIVLAVVGVAGAIGVLVAIGYFLGVYIEEEI